MEEQVIFVYGTLRPAYSRLARGSMLVPPNALHEHGVHLGAGVVPNYLLFDVGEYPGIVPVESVKGTRVSGGSGAARKNEVRGDLFVIRGTADLVRRVINELDEYEECSASDDTPHEYKRIRRTVLLDKSADEILAWVYEYNWPFDERIHRIIPCGDYLEYIENKLLSHQQESK